MLCHVQNQKVSDRPVAKAEWQEREVLSLKGSTRLCAKGTGQTKGWEDNGKEMFS